LKKVLSHFSFSWDETYKRPLRSFDLFDTLLARLYYTPTSTFELVEKNFPFPNFSLFRVAAQSTSDGTLPGIYRRLQEMIDLTDEESARLMAFEFEMELSQIFPIQENLAQVSDGDLIISDTYYSEEQIRQILDKIGLQKKIILYATPRGKAYGSVWKEISSKYAISAHLGDSMHADVKMAMQYGIFAIHYQGSLVKKGESLLERAARLQDPILKVKSEKVTYPNLARLIEELQSKNPYTQDQFEFVAWQTQAAYNLPLLLAASQYLHSYCRKHGFQRILFTARDCCLWIQLFSALYPEYESIYFHTSRYTYLNPTASFIENVKQLYIDKTLIVDGYGRGRSMKRFFKAHLKTTPSYLAIVNPKDRENGMVKATCYELELVNADLVGALYDVIDGEPKRAPAEYDLRYVIAMHECMKMAVSLLPHHQSEDLGTDLISWALKQLKKTELKKVLFFASHHCHTREEQGIVHKHCTSLVADRKR